MVLLLFLLLVCCACQDPHEYEDQYKFSYQVEDGYSGNQFGHSENRLGSSTAGAYHVLLPDGRVQTVEYTVDRYDGYKAKVQYQGSTQKYPHQQDELLYNLGKPAGYHHIKPVYVPLKPVYQPIPEYNQILPVPILVTPAFKQPTPVKPIFSQTPSTLHYQTAFSNLQPTYIPFKESPSHKPFYPSYNSIYDHPTFTSPYVLPQLAIPTPILFQPQSYQPASVQNHRPIHNLMIQPAPSLPHKAIEPHVKPFSPPEHKKHPKHLKPDPYLVSEKELRGRDFTSPFWYPLHPKIVKGYLKHEPGEKEGLALV